MIGSLISAAEKWVALLTLGCFCVLCSHALGEMVRDTPHHRKAQPVTLVASNSDIAPANDPGRGEYLNQFLDWAAVHSKSDYQAILAEQAGYARQRKVASR